MNEKMQKIILKLVWFKDRFLVWDIDQYTILLNFLLLNL